MNIPRFSVDKYHIFIISLKENIYKKIVCERLNLLCDETKQDWKGKIWMAKPKIKKPIIESQEHSDLAHLHLQRWITITLRIESHCIALISPAPPSSLFNQTPSLPFHIFNEKRSFH